MQLLSFFLAIIFSGIISSVVTILLLTRYLKVSGKSLWIYDQKTVEQIKKEANTTQSLDKNDNKEKTFVNTPEAYKVTNVKTEHRILGSLLEGESKQRRFLLPRLTKVFFNIIHTIKLLIYKGVRYIFSSFFSVFRDLFLYVLLLVQIFIQVPIMLFHWLYKQVCLFYSAGIRFGSRCLFLLSQVTQNFFQKKQLDKSDIKSIQQENEVKTISVSRDEKIDTQEVKVRTSSQTDNLHHLELSENKNHHFLLEALVIVVSALCVFLPFVTKVQELDPGYFFFYHIAILALGSAILLKHNSPRIFWAIGIMEWVSVFLWFFKWYSQSYVSSATLFLTIFVCIYAISSYIWYGLKEREYAYIEYALFVLHPFLYMAAIYLLLVGGYKYVVSILFVLIASMYTYFAVSLYKNDKTKNILYVCIFVANIAVVSCVSLLLSGINLLVGLALLAVLVLWFSKYYQLRTTMYVIPVLTYLVGYTFSSTNTAKNFILFFNVRFFGYLVTIGTLLFVGAYVKYLFKRNDEFVYRFISSVCIWLASVLFATAMTLEFTDAKEYTKILADGRADIAKAVFYILFAILLLIYGKKSSSRNYYLASLTISLYAVLYFASVFLF